MYWSQLKPAGCGLFGRAAFAVDVPREGDHHDAHAGVCFAPHGGAGGAEQLLWGPL